MMKVIYVVEPRTIIGGGVRAAMNLAKEFRRYEDVDSIIFGTYFESVDDVDVKFENVKTLNPLGFRYIKSFTKNMSIHKPDIVHCLGLYTALISIVCKKLFGYDYKIVCTVHRVSMNMRFRPLISLIIKYISRNIDHTTFLTEYQRKHYYNNVHFRPEHYTVVPNVIIVNDVSMEEGVGNHKYYTTKMNSDIILSYVGRIIPIKNIGDFIRIIARLNKKGYAVGGLLVGGYSQEYFEELQTIIKQEQVSEKVEFVGYVNNPSLYTASSDFIVTTTTSEALPNLLIESYAFGKVTFSSDIPQMQDLIDYGVNGFTISLDNLDKWADLIISIIENKYKRSEIECNAKLTYERHYEPKIVGRKYYNVYKSLL